jgi:N-acetylglucosamine-6-phosphate deacetylase
MTCHIIEGKDWQTRKPIRLTIREGRIFEVVEPEKVTDDAPLIAPGLIDLQVNGYKGMDVNAPLFDTRDIRRLTASLWETGVTTFYPTVITNSEEVITRSLRILARACREDVMVDTSVGGIHLEGPFVSPEDGPRGAHDRKWVRPPDWEAFCRWQEAAEGRIRLITLSPEWPDSSRFIERCVTSGVKVAIGHTAATPEQIREAVAAGATWSTHWGNGAHVMLPRHPNYLWEQLAADELWTSFIADGHHLPDAVIRVILRVKGEKAVLVSDVVALGGMPPGQYQTPVGGEVVLAPDNRLHLAHDERLLAGSACPLIDAVSRLVVKGLAPLETAWSMASVSPARYMGWSVDGKWRVGDSPDIVQVIWADEGKALTVHSTYKRGQLVYQRVP